MKRPTERMMVGFDSDLKAWMESNHKSLCYPTVSKLVNSVMREFMESKTKPAEDGQQEVVTPEEERSRIIEAIGQLNEKFDDKFQAIRTLDVKGIPTPQNADNVQKLIEHLWGKVMKAGGYVRMKGKPVPISRADLKEYRSLGLLHVRFNQFSDQLQKKEKEQKTFSASPRGKAKSLLTAN